MPLMCRACGHRIEWHGDRCLRACIPLIRRPDGGIADDKCDCPGWVDPNTVKMPRSVA